VIYATLSEVLLVDSDQTAICHAALLFIWSMVTVVCRLICAEVPRLAQFMPMTILDNCDLDRLPCEHVVVVIVICKLHASLLRNVLVVVF